MKTLDEVIECAEKWTVDFDEYSLEKQMFHYLKEYRDRQDHMEAKTHELVGELMKVRDDERKIAKEFARYQEAIINCEQAENKYKRLLEEYQQNIKGPVDQKLLRDDNPELTWEELERMEGKPVWVQWNGPGWMRHSTWVIVISANEKGMSYCTKEEGAGVGFDGYLLRQPYGTGWSAYRKEPA